MKWTPLAALCALGLALMLAGAARGAGGPVPAVQGNPIGVPGSPYRYVAEHGRDTVVKRFGGGSAGASLHVAGQYGVPAVAYDGSLTGLAADGHRLVLAQIVNDYPVRTTRLLVLDTPGLTIAARLVLPGWSTVDGISPDGRWLYLIQYASADFSKYAVRAYDLVARRYLAKPILDPRDRDEAMVGFPLTRVMSADDRWAYTLYDRPSGAPFVHALDTAGRRAVCVDLPSLSRMDTSNLHLALGPGGGTLRIENDGVLRDSVNTRTFVVTAAAVASPPAAAASPPVRSRPARVVHRSRSGGGSAPWGLIALVIAVLGALVVSGVRGLQRDRARRALFDEVDGVPVYRVEAAPVDAVTSRGRTDP